MREPERVALVSAAYPPQITGGIETQTYDLAHALSSLDVEVTVFCGGSDRPTMHRENDNLRIIRLPMANIPPRVVFFQLQNMKLLRDELPKFDVIHTQHSSGSFYGIMKERIGRPWVVSFHDHQLRRLRVFFDVKPWNLSTSDIVYYTLGLPIFELLTRMELKGADHYVACGESGFRDYVNFSRMNPHKTTVIPNGVDLDKIHLIRENHKDDLRNQNDFVIFTCGRLYASKGIQFLLKAMPFVIERHKNVRLKIFGKGPMARYFQKLLKSLNLDRNVTLEGRVSYDHLINEMSNSDLAVFPSMVEVGASLAVMEAMACSRAVVAFRYPFSLEIIEHLRTGYLVQERNVAELAKAICVLIEDDKLRRRIGQNAYLNVAANHDVKQIAKEYLKVYSKVISADN